MAPKKPAVAEKAKTQLIVSLDEAKARLSAQIDKANNLLASKIESQEQLKQVQSEYNIWWAFTKELLRQIFSTSEIADEFARAVVVVGSFQETLQEKITDLHDDLHRHRERLMSIHQRLELFPLAAAEQKRESPNALATIERLIRRFHITAQQLRQRHDNRPTLDVADEYDVQDLLHALLKIYFDDIRPEEWTPSYAGGAARMDFLLKVEKTVVEAKKTRPGLSAREIGNQLLEDIGRYQVHPDCQTLVCFVYDPEWRIVNPSGLENDLSRSANGINVKVIIAPRGE